MPSNGQKSTRDWAKFPFSSLKLLYQTSFKSIYLILVCVGATLTSTTSGLAVTMGGGGGGGGVSGTTATLAIISGDVVVVIVVVVVSAGLPLLFPTQHTDSDIINGMTSATSTAFLISRCMWVAVVLLALLNDNFESFVGCRLINNSQSSLKWKLFWKRWQLNWFMWWKCSACYENINWEIGVVHSRIWYWISVKTTQSLPLINFQHPTKRCKVFWKIVISTIVCKQN
mgnify:CR=1 FL=1